MAGNLRVLRHHERFDGDESCDVQELASHAADALESYIVLPEAGTDDHQRLSKLRLALRMLNRIMWLETGQNPESFS